MEINNILESYSDKQYALFNANLCPGISVDKIIGVRVPKLRKIAKDYYKNPESQLFISSLPHFYLEENMLHGILLNEINNYEDCIKRTKEFLPYVDNWAVCDSMPPKIFKKHKKELLKEIKVWMKSKRVYICRFGILCLMDFYLDEDYNKKYLYLPSSIISNEYYINMMIAWFYATALYKQWDDTIKIIEDKILPKWVHNKTISKACDSYRITKEQKEYLKSLRIK